MLQFLICSPSRCGSFSSSSSQTPSAGMIVQAQFLICSPSRCGSFSSSSTQTPYAGLIVQAAFFSACFFCTLSPHAAGIIFACLICSSGRCGSFFGSTSAVEDEYSRAISPCPAG
ncbi:hypothetical protein ACFX12_019518 [Malus domestica]